MSGAGEEEKIKKMAELRKVLEHRMKSMEVELEEFRVLLDFVDEILLGKGFKRAEPKVEELNELATTVIPKQPAATQPESIPLKTSTGDLLADLILDDGSMRIVLAEDRSFNINTPPFNAFLIDRVLTKMQKKDREAANSGQFAPDQILSYNIVRDGDLIQEIVIKNARSERSRELKSAIRWTLEKMFEKTMQTS